MIQHSDGSYKRRDAIDLLGPSSGVSTIEGRVVRESSGSAPAKPSSPPLGYWGSSMTVNRRMAPPCIVSRKLSVDEGGRGHYSSNAVVGKTEVRCRYMNLKVLRFWNVAERKSSRRKMEERDRVANHDLR